MEKKPHWRVLLDTHLGLKGLKLCGQPYKLDLFDVEACVDFSMYSYPCICINIHSMCICINVYRSVCLSVCLSIYLSIYLSAYLSLYLSVYLSIYQSIHLSIYLSIDPLIYLPSYLSFYHLSIHLSIYLPICLSTSICLFIYSSIYQGVCLSVCLRAVALYMFKTVTRSVQDLRGSLWGSCEDNQVGFKSAGNLTQDLSASSCFPSDSPRRRC